MEYGNFYDIAAYGNQAWKGSFTPKEIACNALDYLCEFNESNKQGKPTHTMQELCKLLIEDIEGESLEAEDFLFEIISNSEWEVRVYYCEHCRKREIVFFSKEELDNLDKHSNREMLIQDAIPEKPQWIREVFVSGTCLCPNCWKKYWNNEF